MTETLFDYAAKRDAGISRSAQSSGDEWQEYALGFVRRYLEDHATLFVDDLWLAGLIKPTSSRGLGAVMQKAAARGWMEQMKTEHGIVGRPSASSNGTMKPVWKSKLK